MSCVDGCFMGVGFIAGAIVGTYRSEKLKPHFDAAHATAHPHVKKVYDAGMEAAQPHIDKVNDALKPHKDKVLETHAAVMTKLEPHIAKAKEVHGAVMDKARPHLQTASEKVRMHYNETVVPTAKKALGFESVSNNGDVANVVESVSPTSGGESVNAVKSEPQVELQSTEEQTISPPKTVESVGA
jgi:hypothetical protein